MILRFDVCVIGHLTRDIIRMGRVRREQVGGTVYYSSVALRRLGLNVAVVTRVGKEDASLLDELKGMGISLFYKLDHVTTTFENIYIEGERLQHIRSTAGPFTKEDIPPIHSTVFHLGPLTRDEISPHLINHLPEGAIVSLDIQGLLRRVDGGIVRIEGLPSPSSFLSDVDILKTDEEEARALSGERDLIRAIVEISKWGPKEVIITLGEKGSLVFAHGKVYSIPPFYQERVIDPTGCGDTYMAGYLYKRVKGSLDFEEIGKFSAAISSLKLKTYGAFNGSIEEVMLLLEEKI